MSIKKKIRQCFLAGLLSGGAVLSVCAFSACSGDAATPSSADGEMNAAEKIAVADEVVEENGFEVSNQSAPEPSEGAAKPAVPDVSSSSEETVSDVVDSETSSLDSVFNILFPDGVEGVDTARHDPDSVGVWHFYDPRGTHDNPDFAYGSMTDPRDGIVYKTTTIGGQVWMAENLNYFDIEGAPSSIKNDWCYWDKPENCESAGRLYTWKVAKRVCPEGWRLPTNDDWTALLTAVGADTLNPIAWTGANVLKSKSGWENSGSGTDDFGFTALPAGKAFFNDLQSGFTNHGCSSYMWSATEADLAAGGDTLAFSVELNCSNELAIVNTVKKYSGFSVRCVKE